MRRYWLAVLAVFAASAAPVSAEVKLHPLFQDNMVLQRGRAVPVWGKADPDEKVSVRLKDQEIATTADNKGNWKVELKDLKAGGPFELTVNNIKLKNVLVGEVWVASGQSNMEWSVAAGSQGDKEEAKGAPKNSMLRMFTVGKTPEEKVVDSVKGSWVEAAPETVFGFSAVGYFFGKELQEKLKVPVGVIHTSWGGTRAEAWTSRESLKGLDLAYAQEIKNHEAAFAKDPNVTKKNANAPSALYNGMLKPLAPYAISGFIWYQGESNVGKAYHYEKLFGAMIENWRVDWQDPTLPFYFVQLAPFLKATKMPGDSKWAELRETQRQTAHKVLYTGMAVITDFGHEADIHPTPKKPVGQRLAYMALEDKYGVKMPSGSARSPDLKSADFANGKAAITLTADKLISLEMVPTDQRTNGAGWRVKEGSAKDAEILGFTIAGKDGKFVSAQAKIDGGRVVVWCDQVSEPAYVRYGWADHPICNLFAANGLPVTPFRSDTLPFTSAPKK